MHPFNWKILKSEHIVKDRWLSLRADTCQLPNGQTIEPYYVLEYPAWVNVVALTKDNHVVLVRQYRHGIQKNVLELPSGGMEKTDASPLDAVKRELLEETGYAGKDFRETGRLSPNPANQTNITYCFLAREVECVIEPNLDDTEDVEIVLLSLPEVIELAKNGEILQSLHVGSLFFALNVLGQSSKK